TPPDTDSSSVTIVSPTHTSHTPAPPPQIHISLHTSTLSIIDSDSSDDDCSYTRRNMAGTMAKGDLAQAVKGHKPTAPPSLTEGKLTPLTVHRLARLCKAFFKAKEIKPEDQVGSLDGSFEEEAISQWFDNNSTRLQKLSMVDFLKEFRTRWLPPRWADELKFEISRAFMSNSHVFSEWKEDLLVRNNILVGYPQHMDDTALRAHLMTHVCQSLREYCYTAGDAF
ncbi:hypothetical protein BDY19DRAFT_969035, partial [Irpex rosettiformis]